MYDQDILSSKENRLQKMLDKLNEIFKNFGMKINIQNIKTMVVRWDGGGVENDC